MTREFTNSLQTYLAGNSLIEIYLVSIETTAGTNYFTSAPFDVEYDSQTWQAQGDFLTLSEGQETAELQIHSVNIILSAVDVNNVTTYGVSDIINKNVEIYRAFLDPVTLKLNGDSAGDAVFLAFKGKIAGYQISNNVNTADIQIQVSSQFINFTRKAGRRSNLVSFQREHPQDFSMQYSHETLTDIFWGRKGI